MPPPGRGSGSGWHGAEEYRSETASTSSVRHYQANGFLFHVSIHQPLRPPGNEEVRDVLQSNVPEIPLPVKENGRGKEGIERERERETYIVYAAHTRIAGSYRSLVHHLLKA